MKANDFRIGNLVEYNLDDYCWVSCRIDWQDLKELSENPDAFNEKHRPIELTSDLKIKHSNLLENHDVKYVHELQNLFFALRNTELEIIL